MFHWICPECGREIAPQAKECAACDPSSAAAKHATSSLLDAVAAVNAVALAEVAAVAVTEVAPVAVAQAPSPSKAVAVAESLAVEYSVPSPVASQPEVPAPDVPKIEAKPEPAPIAAPKAETKLLAAAPEEPSPAPLQPRVTGAPKPPASAVPVPVATAGRDVAPVAVTASAQPPVWKQALPDPQPARAPQVLKAPVREPQPAKLSALANQTAELAAGPEFSASHTTLPVLAGPTIAPPLADYTDYAKLAVSRIQPAKGKLTLAEGAVKEQLSLPGPTLPHELTSLLAAGIAKILVPGGQQQAEPARRSSGWVLSFTVAAVVLAGTLSAVFYAMPGLANSSTPTKQAVTKAIKAASVETPAPPPPPANPLARIVEVAGVRFITDLPGRPPEIHYLVVNHGNVPLIGLTVQVTLRSTSGESSTPLSQFAFKAPRLAPYESKEMVSSIERFNRAVALPDWRDLQADIQIAQ